MLLALWAGSGSLGQLASYSRAANFVLGAFTDKVRGFADSLVMMGTTLGFLHHTSCCFSDTLVESVAAVAVGLSQLLLSVTPPAYFKGKNLGKMGAKLV